VAFGFSGSLNHSLTSHLLLAAFRQNAISSMTQTSKRMAGFFGAPTTMPYYAA